MSLLFFPPKKPVATFDTSKYDVSYPGYGVVIARLKNPIKKVSRNSSSKRRDTGVGRRMSYAARKKFIKDKNPDYTVKETKQGATYGVRQIVT
tara:strand:+ start:1074 stop:1352 length:279 start_codon:yes stop_codon:yes gene_type:complete